MLNGSKQLDYIHPQGVYMGESVGNHIIRAEH